MVDLITILLLALAGALVGLIASMLGIGGGALMVPILIYGFHIEIFLATTISSFFIIFTSGTSIIVFSREKRIEYMVGLTLVLVAIPAAFLGATVASSIHRDTLRLIFGIFILLITIRKILSLLRNSNNEEANRALKKLFGRFSLIKTRSATLPSGEEISFETDLTSIALFGVIGGFAAGLLGIGGGVIYVPVILYFTGAPMHIVTATSTFVVFFSGFTSTLVKTQVTGWTNVILNGLPLAFGAILGAHFGARKVGKIKAKHLQLMFFTLLALVGVRMIIG